MYTIISKNPDKITIHNNDCDVVIEINLKTAILKDYILNKTIKCFDNIIKYIKPYITNKHYYMIESYILKAELFYNK